MAEIITPGGGGSESNDDAPKIHIDSDWKAEAQAEKDRLDAEAQEKAATGGATPGGGMPPANFQTLWSELASQAYVFLGAIPDPKTGQAIVAPEYAKHYIDLLGVLKDKTEGNLSDEESEDFLKVLAELREVFVRVSGYVAAEMAKQDASEAGEESPEA